MSSSVLGRYTVNGCSEWEGEEGSRPSECSTDDRAADSSSQLAPVDWILDRGKRSTISTGSKIVRHVA
jgi:hypothetical protein